ncbi:MAG: hypothetical protein JST82_00985 [Bacteroidetes bacterium]|nr:hypothetical protein [Bacteroidota bacterium]
MRYLCTLLFALTFALHTYAGNDSVATSTRTQLVLDFGPAMPYVKYGQAFGLQLDVSRMAQFGAEYMFSKYKQQFNLLAALKVGYIDIRTHYHSFMKAPYLTRSNNVQIAGLLGWRYDEPVFKWLSFVTGMQVGPVYIMSTEANSGMGTVAMYGEASMGFRFNRRITTSLKYFVSPGTYRQYYDERHFTTLGYGITGLVSEVKVILGKR